MVLGDLLALGEYIGGAGTIDPLSAFLLVIGHVFFLVSFAVFGYLTLGAVLSLARPA